MNTDNEQKSLDGTGASIEQDLGGHPLFPRPETEYGPDLRKFDIIHIHRWLPDGTKEVCPRVWKGSELRSWEQIVDMYGGECTYQLSAQCGKTHRFQAYSEKFYFSGPARKPFHHEPKRTAGETAAPAPNPPPQPPALDVAVLVKLMLEREARAAEKMMEREIRAAENQSRMQETLLRIALERPAPPNPMEGIRDVIQLMQGMNNHPAAANGPDAVKMLERGIAMGKELAGEGGGEEIPWGAMINAAATGLSLLKKKAEEKKDDAKPKSSPPPSPKQPASPAAAPMPYPNIYVDPQTGIPYMFHPSVGVVRLDAIAAWQMYGHVQHPVQPQYYPYPVGVPNMSPPMQQPPVPVPMAAHIPQPVAAPPVPPTLRMPPPAVPHPAPPPPPAPVAYATAPVLQPPVAASMHAAPMAPPTVRSPRPAAAVVPPAQPVRALVSAPPLKPPKAPAPPGPPKQTPPAQPSAQTSGVPPPSSKPNTMAIPNAIDELSDGVFESIGDDFAQVVNDGMNSPLAQQIMQDPRYQALRDAVRKGEISAADVSDEFIHTLFGSEGGEL